MLFDNAESWFIIKNNKLNQCFKRFVFTYIFLYDGVL